MSEPREIELKLELEPSAGKVLAKRLASTLGDPQEPTERLNAVYYDTRNHALHRRGFALRVRQEGDRRVQTLKAGAGGAGMFDRAEWQTEAGPDGPDPSLFEAREAQALFKAGRTLAPLFSTEVMRSTWTAKEPGAEIEIALDSGRIVADGAEMPLAELELELKKGAPEDLFRFARRIAELGEMRLAVRSKSERGYDLVRPRGKLALKAEPVDLTRDMKAGEAFQAIARACLRHFRLNEPGVFEARDMEALHQVRVAIRRLRSAMSLFKEILTGSELPVIKHELRLVSGCLGDARNLDVYRAGIAAAEVAPGGEEAHREELARLDAERERAYDRVIRKLGAKRFRLFTLDLSAWIETGSWLHDEASADLRKERVWRFAKHVLERHRRKVKRKGRDLEAISPAERHRVRIEAKKLRYAGEFFAALVKGKKARRRRDAFVGALEVLQDRLGELNDIETGRGLAGDGQPPAAEGAGVGQPDGATAATVSGPETEEAQEAQETHETDEAHQAGEAAALQASLKAYDAFRDVKPFWR